MVAQTELAKAEQQSIESILKLQSEAYTQLSHEHKVAIEALQKEREDLQKEREELVKSRELLEDLAGDLDDQTEKVTQQLKVLIKVTESLQK